MPRFVVAYEAGCGPCSAFKAAVHLVDLKGRIGFASLQEADQEGLLDPVEAPLRYRSFHLISSSGEVKSGADALLPLAGLVLPGGRSLESLGSIPWVKAALRFGYTTLSRLHGRGACGALLD